MGVGRGKGTAEVSPSEVIPRKLLCEGCDNVVDSAYSDCDEVRRGYGAQPQCPPQLRNDICGNDTGSALRTHFSFKPSTSERRMAPR